MTAFWVVVLAGSLWGVVDSIVGKRPMRCWFWCVVAVFAWISCAVRIGIFPFR